MGILITMFVAFGISVFYEPPELETAEDASPVVVRPPSPPSYESPEYQEWEEEQQELMDERQEYWEAYADAMRVYHRNVLFIVYPFGLLFTTLGLVLRPRLDIIKPGLLLGGVGTIIFAVSQGFGDISNALRFGAIAIGLAVLIFLGYRTLLERRQPSNSTTEEKEGV